MLIQKFQIDFATNDMGGNCIDFDTPKIGDSIIKGKFLDNDITKNMQIKIKVLVNKKEYSCVLDKTKDTDRLFEIKLDNPLVAGDNLQMKIDALQRVINFSDYEKNGIIHIWADYYALYSKNFDRIL